MIEANQVRDQTFCKQLFGRLKLLSGALYETRTNFLLSFYGTAFDARTDCFAVISMPEEVFGRPNTLTPTQYMVYREAKFVLDSDSTEYDALNEIWPVLHEKIEGSFGVYRLAEIASVNANAREQILKCHDHLLEAYAHLMYLLSADKYCAAQLLGEDEIRHTRKIVDSILASYDLLTPHTQ